MAVSVKEYMETTKTYFEYLLNKYKKMWAYLTTGSNLVDMWVYLADNPPF